MAVRVADGAVVAVPDEGVVVRLDVGGELVPLDAGGDPAATDLVGDPEAAEAPGTEPRVRGADFVWKESTPASPATVAAITIGARFIEFALRDSTLVFDSSGI